MSSRSDIAFVFPGQGSQKPGMLKDFAGESVVKACFDTASEVLGYDLWAMCQEGTAEELSQTEVTQPALLTCSTALWRLWCERSSVRPVSFAGHSLGEWSALVAANVVTLEDAVNIVRLRGKFMQEAVPEGVGAMAAVIGLSAVDVEALCAAVSSASEGVVSPVNYNSPEQTVVAGNKAAVESAAEKAKAMGAKRAIILPVSAPFHTSLMVEAANQLAEVLAAVEFNRPEAPIIHNVGIQPENDPVAIKSLMLEQIYSPVPWVACIEAMQSQGVESFVECGPGKVLTGLGRRINRALKFSPLDSAADFEKSLLA